MKVWTKIVIAIAALAVLLVVVGLFLPRLAHVERSVSVKAAPSTVFTVLNSFRQFNRWSPWADIDPQMKSSFEGPESGVGARLTWSGNSSVGSGSQEIIDSQATSRIVIKLTLGDFPGDFRATYALEPEGEGTRITWGYDGDYGNSPVGRWFGVFADKMLGPDYEKGLVRLKALVESLPHAEFSALQITTVDTQGGPVLLYAVRSGDDPNSIGVALGVAYSKLGGFISTQGLNQVAPPLAIFYGESQGALSLDAGIPVDRTDVTLAAPIRSGRTYAGKALRAVYQGPYSGLASARQGLTAFLAASGYVQDGPRWEQYVSDPSRTAATELITYLFVPIR